jgi:hypothetical protein
MIVEMDIVGCEGPSLMAAPKKKDAKKHRDIKNDSEQALVSIWSFSCIDQ